MGQAGVSARARRAAQEEAWEEEFDRLGLAGGPPRAARITGGDPRRINGAAGRGSTARDGGGNIGGEVVPITGGDRPTGSAERRTIQIHGYGAEGRLVSTRHSRRRAPRPAHERVGFRPDRVAMWAVLLGLLLVLVAATSSRAASISKSRGAPVALVGHPLPPLRR